MSHNIHKKENRKGLLYKLLYKVARFFYGKIKFVGIDNIKAPCIIVANHAQAYGPLMFELCFPLKQKMWCISDMLHLKTAPRYIYKDFFKYKSKKMAWLYWPLSFLLSPILVYLCKNIQPIAVYKDAKILSTFKNTVQSLKSGENIIIFPETHEQYNHIVNNFQNGFVNISKFYEKQCQKPLLFVPAYVCPKLKTIVFGDPIMVDDYQLEQKGQCQTICNQLMQEITALAQSLPAHKVVPYANIRQKHYPDNI